MNQKMYRSHNCGELREANQQAQVTLSGWVQTVRDKGFCDMGRFAGPIRNYPAHFDEERSSKEIMEIAKSLGS